VLLAPLPLWLVEKIKRWKNALAAHLRGLFAAIGASNAFKAILQVLARWEGG